MRLFKSIVNFTLSTAIVFGLLILVISLSPVWYFAEKHRRRRICEMLHKTHHSLIQISYSGGYVRTCAQCGLQVTVQR